MKQQFENSISRHEFFLLPNHFKKTGYVIAIFAAVVLLLAKISNAGAVIGNNTNNGENPGTVLTLFSTLLIIGLLCIAWAKEKLEDEGIIFSRSKSLSIAFILGLLYIIIMPVVSMLGGNTPQSFDGSALATAMLLIYLISFSLQKWGL